VSNLDQIRKFKKPLMFQKTLTEFSIKEASLTKQLNKFRNLQRDFAAAKTTVRQQSSAQQQQADVLTDAQEPATDATNDLQTTQLQLVAAQADLQVALLDAIGNEMAESNRAPGPFYGRHLENTEQHVINFKLWLSTKKLPAAVNPPVAGEDRDMAQIAYFANTLR